MADKDDFDLNQLSDDDFINQLKKDPANSDLNVITGVFLGKGVDEEMLRLYTTLQLNKYFEIPKDKILGVKRFPSNQIVIWIPGDLKVRIVSTATLSGDFLKGNIQSGYASRGGGLGPLLNSIMGRSNNGGTSFFPGCRSNDFDPVCNDTLSPQLCPLQPPPPTGCGC